MRLSPISLVALLVVAAIAVYMTVLSFGVGASPNSPTGGALGSYGNAIKAAQQSVAAQDRAAQHASTGLATP